MFPYVVTLMHLATDQRPAELLGRKTGEQHNGPE